MLSHPCSLRVLHFVPVCKGDGGRAKFRQEIPSNPVACQGGQAGQKECVAPSAFVYGSAALLFTNQMDV